MDTFSTTMISSPRVRDAAFPVPSIATYKTFKSTTPAPLTYFTPAPHICLAHPSMTQTCGQ